ncbi:hypothetical protein MTR_4g069930 [Medicago truncatula]|uniref:Uncharacterized protein n=1 Tax=Medicago truncatula TaxID=3880 RepID=G7JG51_MEDTR|nr:hypothetical protein MTR_4g069930 [Medicago truncatula]
MPNKTSQINPSSQQQNDPIPTPAKASLTNRWQPKLANSPQTKGSATIQNFEKQQKSSIAGNRTRVSWVKARYPNRWTTMEVDGNFVQQF